ncbi:hypothetical protein [Nostoc piscinale]|uniref:hypothetical protein n=1 Tax=Nostoc piscinale TaxID=224012 RepID=UPI0011873A12|nr:hypothetical protein [Nostoc piscinale]
MVTGWAGGGHSNVYTLSTVRQHFIYTAFQPIYCAIHQYCDYASTQPNSSLGVGQKFVYSLYNFSAPKNRL